ncbi:MAG TPA: hypothetical protein PLZ62_01770 [bacterium]|nr:hypothetical protein [bacterium]
MTNYLKLKPLVVGLVFLGVLELFAFFPDLMLWGSFIVLMLVVGGVLWMMNGNWEEGVIRRSMLPILLSIGVLSFSFFMPKLVFRQIVYVTGAICIYFLMLYVSQFPFKSFLITRLNFSFVSLIAAYLLFYSIFHISVGFALPLWLLMLLVVGFGFMIFYSILWASGLDRSSTILYTVLFSLIMSEIFLIVSFWPVDPSAKSIVLVVAMYIFWGLLSHWLERVLTKRVVIEYILVGVFLMSIVLVTATWLPPFLI